MFNPWLALTFQAVRLTWEAQGVMALRMMDLAGGGKANHSEARVMILERASAPVETHVAAISDEPGDSNSARAPKKALNVHKNRVRSNKRRLSQ
jgi:hypothetical protein